MLYDNVYNVFIVYIKVILFLKFNVDTLTVLDNVRTGAQMLIPYRVPTLETRHTKTCTLCK